MVTFQCSFGESLGFVAPYYNLALVLIVILLFLRLFSLHDKKTYTKPWYFLFFSVMVFVVEEVVTVMEAQRLIAVPKVIFPLFEMVIVASFIYMLLLQKEYYKTLK